MRFGDVNIPKELMDAQRNGTLAIFAGAGVSMPPPSDYPDFKALADEIGAGVLTREANEPDDRFLGRLVKRGLPVHQRVKQILSNPQSKPNELHEYLLRLCLASNGLHMVTTNFDSHFTTKAKELGILGEVFNAPALPVGDRFKGIVYTHGNVDKDAEDLVLTDSDFGRAYLTEGWATRFLQALFSAYTVLFVGYSHNDVVMKYLARGLPPDSGKGRFALADAGKDDHWDFLGITPIPYSPEDEHIALRAAITKWADHCALGHLHHERRIREIVSQVPPVDPEIDDYLLGAATDPTNLQFFVRHANTPEWLHWAEKKEMFNGLFQPGERVDECSRQIAYWFAQTFMRNHPEAALALLERNKVHLNYCFWDAIASGLWPRHLSITGRPLAEWITVLLRTPIPPHGETLLNHVLGDCKPPEDLPTAVILFEYLTRPRLDLNRLWVADPQSGRQVHWEANTVGDPSELTDSWKKVLKPNLDSLACRLEPIITAHLQQAHFALRAVGSANEEWDPSSFARRAIDEHEQDRHPAGLAVLVDAARDVIEWLLVQERDRASGVAAHWAGSGVPLLKRLAIHCMVEDTHVKPDDKIKWAIGQGFIYAYRLKHEVFRLLKTAYPGASKSCRKRLLAVVSAGPPVKRSDKERKEIRAYEIYNLLQWLHEADPGCSAATRRLESVKRKHPHFEPREYPDLDFYTTAGWVGPPRSPLSVRELLSREPVEQIELLLTYAGDKHPLGPTREGLLATVAQAVSQSGHWAWQLMKAIESKQAWDSDLWDHIFQGYEKTRIRASQCTRVLRFIMDHPQLHVFRRSLSHLVESLVHNEENRLPWSCLPHAEKLAANLWDVCAQADDAPGLMRETWVEQAINHPGGCLAMFWIGALSMRRAKAGDNWTGIPAKHKDMLNKIICGRSLAAQLGRVIIASQVCFLFSIAEEWTIANTLPLFKWSTDSKRAEQAWHGFLVWGRPNEGLVKNMLPCYEESFAHLSAALKPLRDPFSHHLTLIAVYGSANPLQAGWLMKFIASVEPEDRKNWAIRMGQALASMKPSEIEQLWNRWLGEYWGLRSQATPIPLDAEEQEEMVQCWLPHLAPVFPEAVEKVHSSPILAITRTWVFHKLGETDFAERYPEPLARLVLRLLEGTKNLGWEGKDVAGLVQRMIPTSAPRSVLHQICQQLAGLRYSKADKLDTLIG